MPAILNYREFGSLVISKQPKQSYRSCDRKGSLADLANSTPPSNRDG